MQVLISIFHSIIVFFSTAITFAPKFIPGVVATLGLSFFSIIFGMVFGLVAVLLKLSRKKFLMRITDIYITIVRGTPLLLQLIFIFYVLPSIGIKIGRFPSAIIGLAFHNGAYISEIFRGAIESIHYGQMEAARSIGMTKLQAMKRVILPQAFKRSVPALGNQFIIAVKDSSLASVITITEIILLARQFSAATFKTFPILFVAGGYYLIITMGLTKILNIIELKLKVNERS
ncbi:amino acid ABC transporter permease [Clostridium grantii]|uniref:Amino acid ABC transporter membrane protein, PAAT family (TC 3.A.1.3.-) n=1 Tax=Clostridium grantii DSM 8605 TaxID=1121316 RepID=A0A1M5V6U5_9CLOT|nr:amino acid ABC transporter permease [Clostridium grantii]SHH70643.1 amino acid ABC transporter membrane protein, PAAT family (TC 3.A.1.3.-) [Clostridium grantii DSM 8605]